MSDPPCSEDQTPANRNKFPQLGDITLARAVQQAIAPENQQVIQRARRMVLSRFTESHMIEERCRYLREIMAGTASSFVAPRPSPPVISDFGNFSLSTVRNQELHVNELHRAAPPVERWKTLHVIYDVEGWAYWHHARSLAISSLLTASGWRVTIGKDLPEERVDLVLLLNYSRAAAVAEQLRANFPNSRLIVSFNSGGGRNEPLLKKCVEVADQVIVINQETFNTCLNAANVVYIPYPYQDSVFWASDLHSSRPPRILWSASRSYAEHKGLSLMQSIQPRLERMGYEVDLRIVNSYGTEIFTPEQMADWYHTGRVYVVAALNEGTPVGGLVAAACGNAIVSTRVGVMPEWIHDGINGVLVDRNAQSLLDGIIPAVEFGDQMSSRPKEDIRIYSATRLMPQYLKLFERLVVRVSF